MIILLRQTNNRIEMDCDYFQQLTFSLCRVCVCVCLSLEAETKQCLTLSAVSQISVER